MGCVNTTQFFPNLFVLGTLSSKRWENIGKSTLGFTGLTQIWERIGKYSSYLKNSLGIKLGILALKQVMEAFWEKLARGNFKLLRTGSFSTVNIFWAHLLGYLHDFYKILDFKKAKKINIEHKACINCIIKVAFM